MIDQLADASVNADPGIHAGRPAIPLAGLPRLMTLAFEGVDLAPRAQALIERARLDPADANALMDLSTILLLQVTCRRRHTPRQSAGRQREAQALGRFTGGPCRLPHRHSAAAAALRVAQRRPFLQHRLQLACGRP